MGNILLNLLCPDLIHQLNRLEHDNLKLKRKIKKKKKKLKTLNWTDVDEKNYSHIKTIEYVSCYCDKLLQDYMQFHTCRTQTSSMCVAEWTECCVAVVSELSKVAELYINKNHDEDCSFEEQDLPTFVPVN